MTTYDSVELIRADTVTARATSWLWPGFLLAGKLNLLAGSPSTGKTTVALDLAAKISRGDTWPDGTPAEAGHVLIWSGEDNMAETLLPRLMAAGADLLRVHFWRSRAGRAPDLLQLQREMHRIGGIRLLIIDPLALVVQGNANGNTAVRDSLEGIAALADETGCAVLGIMHFTKGSAKKNALERFAGAGAFGQVARLALVCVRQAASESKAHSLVRVKSNLGPDGDGFAYQVDRCHVGDDSIETSRIVWGEPLEGSAQQLLDAADDGGAVVERAIQSELQQWLTGVLNDSGGTAEQRVIMEAAEQAGFSPRSVQRARVALGISTRQEGFGAEKRSLWTLPASTVPIVPTEVAGTDGTHGTDA